jgi:hypothetical protein
MKSLLKSTAFSCLTIGSLTLSGVIPAYALSAASQKSLTPQAQDISTEELVAYDVYCETRMINGYVVSCCADSYGNWSCVY